MLPKSGERPGSLPKKKSGGKSRADDATPKTAAQEAAPGWRKAKSGLFWVKFALFFLVIPGALEFARLATSRYGIEIPKGRGWIIEGFMNTEDQDSVNMNLQEQIEVLAYGVPILLGGLALTLGRLTCGAVPRNSGVKGAFALSGLSTLLVLVCLVGLGVSHKMYFERMEKMFLSGGIVCGLAAECWFLMGLASSGVALKRPGSTRAVSLVVFFAAFVAAAGTVGWDIYKMQFRMTKPNEDILLFEKAALMIGWLLVICIYWRAVGAVRQAIREFLESVGD